jgi:hypothetical protein
MQITAKVRLKSVEAMMDLIEQDEGELMEAHYIPAAGLPAKRKPTKGARKSRTSVTPALRKQVMMLKRSSPGLTLRDIGNRFNLSQSSVSRILLEKR